MKCCKLECIPGLIIAFLLPCGAQVYLEFGNKRAEIMELAERIENKEVRKRDLFDTKLLQLAQQVKMFLDIQNWVSP